jgi:hypothetical protein
MKLTLENIKNRVQAIKKEADDDENAHGMEDSLYADFITHVAEEYKGTPLGDKAAMVLSTSDISFGRWTA